MDNSPERIEKGKNDLETLESWAKDIFEFSFEALGMKPSEPIDALRGKSIEFTDAYGEKRTTVLFSEDGQLIYHDLAFYKRSMFKNQSRVGFRGYGGKRFTWQQTVKLTAYQRGLETFDKDSFDAFARHITVSSGHGCFAKGTQIRNADGSTIPVEDVKVGDLLMGDDSTPRKVQELYRGQEEMFRVQYTNGEYYDVNKSHNLALIATQNHGKQKTGDITKVKVSEYLQWSDRKKRTNVGFKAPQHYPERDLPIDPYTFGVWLADGGSLNGVIYNPEMEIINALAYPVKKQNVKDKTKCPAWQVEGLTKKLRLLGVKGNKHIPFEYLTSGENQRLELLAGILDGDGYFDRGSYEIVQKREVLARNIVDLARSLGMRAGIKKVRKGCQTGAIGTYWRVYISRRVERLPMRAKRKKSYKSRQGLNRKISVTSLGMGDYYGFELDGNHMFLLADSTVTFNTGKTSSSCIIAIHFLICFQGAQVGVTANTEDQLKDIFLKELYFWRKRLPQSLQDELVIMDDFVRVSGEKDWFLRARVGRKETPEALAGLHAKYILILVDEASAVPDNVFEVMKGALTGDNYIVIYDSNPTRTEGEFFDSHKAGSKHVKLVFNSEDSPIVSDSFVQLIIDDYGCFPAGTMIATLFGDKAIEDIKVGDKVLTPNGLKRVLKSGITRKTDTLINLDNSIFATPNHKFVVENDRFVRIDSLEYNMRVSKLNVYDIWVIQSKISRMEVEYTGLANAIINDGLVRTVSTDSCTGKFGLKILEKHLKDFTFTTKTTIRSIMPLTIYSCYLLANIYQCTLRERNYLKNTLKSLWQVLSRGENPKRVKSGIESMELIEQEKVGRVGDNIRGFVYFAIQSLWGGIKQGSVIARRLVLERHEDKVVSMTWLGNACNAIHLLLRTNTLKQKPVQENARTTLIKTKCDVYNLEVEDDHVYYANGFLVSNSDSDEYLIRVKGRFASTAEMDDKGWIPLFANVTIHFEPQNNQIIKFPVIGVDPAGQGRDRSIVQVRDSIYLKEVLNEKTSTPKDLARKVETIRDQYGAKSNDIGIEAFGIGAEVVANINTKMGDHVNALLTDKPREETKHLYHTWKAELAWLLRKWLLAGGIIITNNHKAWLKEFAKIKYKRDLTGRIQLMGKVEFKKEYKFSPDRFDASIHTFFKEEGEMPVVLTKKDLENKELAEWLQKANALGGKNEPRSYSSMG